LASLRRPSHPPNIPEIKVNGVEATPDAAVSVEVPDAAQYEEQIPKHDEAALRLEQQLNALRQSEQLQRERQHMAAMQPSPEQVLQFWKHNGLDEPGERFLRTQPQHILGLTDFASRQAIQQGHQPGSTAHTEAAKAIFHDNLERLLEPQVAATAPAPQSTLLPLPEPPSVSHFSAPVSREVPTSTGQRPSSTRITLTKEEKDMARIAGVSEVEYAKQKGRLIEEKNSGNYGEHRYR
jgi:hypothetical protein